MNERTFVQRNAVVIYFFLAFLVAWGGSFAAAGPKFLRGEAIEFSDIGPIALAMLAAPSLAGLLMTHLVDGRAGLRDLLGRMKVWRVGGWYAALLIFPGLILAVSLVLAAFVSTEFIPIFFAIGIPMGLLAGFLEETGWMGFAFPRMSSRYGLLRASVYLGLLHGVWHLVAGYLGQSADLGAYWPPYFTAFVVCMVAVRVLIVWVYANTQSLMMAQLMHASSSGFLAVFMATDISPANWLTFYSVYAVALWLVALGVIRQYGRDLSRQG